MRSVLSKRAAFNALILGLKALGVASRLPDAVLTVGRGSVPAELSRQPTCHWTAVSRAGNRLGRRVVTGEGDYRSSVEATLVFAQALIPWRGTDPRRSGVLGVDEVLRLRDLIPSLESHGIHVQAV